MLSRRSWCLVGLLFQGAVARGVALSSFVPQASNLTASCIIVYDARIPGCHRHDFEPTPDCSARCIAGLAEVQYEVLSNCGQDPANHNNIIGDFLDGNGIGKVCGFGFYGASSTVATPQPQPTTALPPPVQPSPTSPSAVTSAAPSSSAERLPATPSPVSTVYIASSSASWVSFPSSLLVAPGSATPPMSSLVPGTTSTTSTLSPSPSSTLATSTTSTVASSSNTDVATSSSFSLESSTRPTITPIILTSSTPAAAEASAAAAECEVGDTSEHGGSLFQTGCTGGASLLPATSKLALMALLAWCGWTALSFAPL